MELLGYFENEGNERWSPGLEQNDNAGLIVATQRRIDANRRNAQRSTGPRTPEGRQRSSQNATTHGLLAKIIVLPDENPAEFDALFEACRAEYRPHGFREAALVERIAIGRWKERRADRIETGLLTAEILNERVRQAQAAVDACKAHFDLSALDRIADEKQHRAAKAHAASLAAEQAESNLTAAAAFRRDAAGKDVVGKLYRYRAANERMIAAAERELDRLQASRRVGTAATPVIVDVDSAVVEPQQ